MTYLLIATLLSVILFILLGVSFWNRFVDSYQEVSRGCMFWAIVLGVIICGFTIINMIGGIPAGYNGVQVWFGKVQEKTLPEGFYLKNPMMAIQSMSVRMRTVTRHTSQTEGQENAMVANSSDQLAISLDSTFSYVSNKKYLPLIYRILGDDASYEKNLIYPAMASSLRNAVAMFTGEEVYTSKRVELAKKITEEFQVALKARLMGIPEFAALGDELTNVFNVLPVEVRRADPPQLVRDAIERKVAADQEMLRQKTMSQVAKMQSETQGNNGKSITLFKESLPPGTTMSETIEAYRAFTERDLKEAMGAAFAKGTAVVYITDGGTPVAIKQQ